MKQEEPILVAIHCLVYNHEPYLRDCFEGFVMQKTNFRFVAIVHDDVSTDGSAAIIREYEEKYPDIFKPIYETENQWSKHDGSLERIMNKAIDATGAKYVAMCEGDDYWTDPLKLQKQVDFLEEHEEFSLCCHGYSILNVDKRTMVEKRVVLPPESKDGLMFTNAENLLNWYTKTLTLLIRKTSWDQLPDTTPYKYWRDAHMNYYLLKNSKGYYLNFVGGTYHAHNGGVYYSLSSVQKGLIAIRIYDELYANNLSDGDLFKILQVLIKDEEEELIWLIRDKEWKSEYFKAINEISVLLIKSNRYHHVLQWWRKLIRSVYKKIKRRVLKNPKIIYYSISPNR